MQSIAARNDVCVPSFDFDDAMCTYLGGDRDSGEIQIGNREARLIAAYGDDAAAIKELLDEILEAAVSKTAVGFTDEEHSIAPWLAMKLPGAAPTTRRKIKAHVLYYLQH